MSLSSGAPWPSSATEVVSFGTSVADPSVLMRRATPAEAHALHRLITVNIARFHLLPRNLDELTRRASNFIVAMVDDEIGGCAELAPLSREVAEVRSLVVEEDRRGAGIGTELVRELLRRARSEGFVTLCAFTHDPTHFLRLGFSIVPHVWIPEKIATDCATCPAFRKCGQYAVLLRVQ